MWTRIVLAKIHRRMLGTVLWLSAATCWSVSPLEGQGPAPVDSTASRWTNGISAGPSFFFGAEGNVTGAQVEALLMRRLDSRTALRLTTGAHLFGLQPLYPCTLQRAGTCYSASQRIIYALDLGVQRVLLPERANRRGSLYVVGGATSFVSSREARRLPACQPDLLCSAESVTAQFTDIDGGLHVGLGTAVTLGRRQLYLESRWHHQLWRQHRIDPYSSFQLFPLSAGIRF